MEKASKNKWMKNAQENKLETKLKQPSHVF